MQGLAAVRTAVRKGPHRIHMCQTSHQGGRRRNSVQGRWWQQVKPGTCPVLCAGFNQPLMDTIIGWADTWLTLFVLLVLVLLPACLQVLLSSEGLPSRCCSTWYAAFVPSSSGSQSSDAVEPDK